MSNDMKFDATKLSQKAQTALALVCGALDKAGSPAGEDALAGALFDALAGHEFRRAVCADAGKDGCVPLEAVPTFATIHAASEEEARKRGITTYGTKNGSARLAADDIGVVIDSAIKRVLISAEDENRANAMAVMDITEGHAKIIRGLEHLTDQNRERA